MTAAEPRAIERVETGRALQSLSALGLCLTMIVALGTIGLLPVAGDGRVRASVWGAALVLGVWHVGLAIRCRRDHRRLTVARDVRKQHYLQACAQGAVFLYWGYYWREVYHSAHLIAAQLFFAYAFDMLLSWSRRDTYSLGFAPFPVIFSINLFLWFKADWFYLQLLLVAVGFAAKELVRWERNGRQVHVFNPSSLPLGVASLALIVAGATDMTWGQEIATTLNRAPHIYAVIFLVALPGQFLFGVTTMTLSAVVSMYAFGLAYFAATGTYYFIDSYIPIAVFLGMHLLFTDPSTSPRTELGRLLFGMLYAAGVIALYKVLGAIGAPTFYDKLLAVPIMNVAIRAIDRLALGPLRRWDRAALARGLAGRRRHLAYISIWTSVFITMSIAHALGGTHRGQWITFWLAACQEGRPGGCRQAAVLAASHCSAGSGWACNEYGILLQPELRPERAVQAFERSCNLGFEAGCDNRELAVNAEPRRGPPGVGDYLIVLRGRAGNLDAAAAPELRRRACEQGFLGECR